MESTLRAVKEAHERENPEETKAHLENLISQLSNNIENINDKIERLEVRYNTDAY